MGINFHFSDLAQFILTLHQFSIGEQPTTKSYLTDPKFVFDFPSVDDIFKEAYSYFQSENEHVYQNRNMNKRTFEFDLWLACLMQILHRNITVISAIKSSKIQITEDKLMQVKH